MDKLIRNAIQCKLCGEIIESTTTHNFVSCKCENCSVNGGLEYQRLLCKNIDDIINLAVYDTEK